MSITYILTKHAKNRILNRKISIYDLKKCLKQLPHRAIRRDYKIYSDDNQHDFNINNDVNFGFDMTFDQSETLMTTILIDDPEDFNQQDLSTSLSLKPRIGYSFTKYITGDVYFNYIFTENKTTGSKKERDFGFNVRIKIQG